MVRVPSSAIGRVDLLVHRSAVRGSPALVSTRICLTLIRDHYLSAIAHGLQDADWSALAEVAARDAGLTTG